MVCPRCIAAVERIFDELNIPAKVELGQAKLSEDLTELVRSTLSEKLNQAGFELLEDSKSVLISRIKTIIIDRIHHQENPPESNLSEFLSRELAHDYSYLSRLFSSVEGQTIERFTAKQRTEKIKELLIYGEETLAEITDQLGFNSVAYLSAQFKKETGITPSQFKKQTKPSRISLDRL
ncbi:AraC family transcriptional regulator [Algoriphagus sanaruensis]|uniref:AraC family transcriptional regulator n=2 Tax=Algoriphagus sanaruensis TaxID=1727163 RepID=A0A142EPL0_9BACT|nr:AraC family transcriptional regulator [Algoriphagus sanaruensis]